jgi:hypothetical protein
MPLATTVSGMAAPIIEAKTPPFVLRIMGLDVEQQWFRKAGRKSSPASE